MHFEPLVILTPCRWVDNPVATGFTEGKVMARNEKDVAHDFLGFLKNWENIFGVRGYRIFLTGESYAGRYIPYISAAMLDRDDKGLFDVRGRSDPKSDSTDRFRLTDE